MPESNVDRGKTYDSDVGGGTMRDKNLVREQEKSITIEDMPKGLSDIEREEWLRENRHLMRDSDMNDRLSNTGK